MFCVSELPTEHASEHAPGHTGACALGLVAKIRRKRVGEDWQRHALEPDRARSGPHDHVVTVLAEHAVCDTGKARRLEAHGRVERPDVTRMDTKALSGGELVGGHLTRELDPSRSAALEALEDEALTAEDGATEGLLQSDGR